MDAAIDHFAIMGYRKADVRSVVNRLLRDVYGRDGWPFLEDSWYSVVQEALFEMQEELAGLDSSGAIRCVKRACRRMRR